MARNFIYQVNSKGYPSDWEITPSDFYESDYVTAWCDYFYEAGDFDEEITAFSLFSELVEGERFKDVVKIDTEEKAITLYPGFKAVWFSHKFEQFEELVNACTMDDFIDDLYAYRVRRLLGGSFDAFIQDDADGSLQKMDAYFRNLCLDEPVTLRFGGFVGFHY